jgi:5-formyltetrahydrofolate cyclo-ligase
MDMVKIESWDDYLSLPKNNWNIPEPTQEYPRENGTRFCSVFSY